MRRGSHSLRLTNITTSQEIFLNTHLGQSAMESPGQEKLSTALGNVNKKRKGQWDTRRPVPGGEQTGVTATTGSATVDKTSAHLTNNSVTLIKED